MPRQTQDSACIVPLVCFELLTLAFAMAAGQIERMTGTSTAVEPDAHTVVIAVPQGKETVSDACHLDRGESISCIGAVETRVV